MDLDDVVRQARLELDATDQEIDATDQVIREAEARREHLRERRAGLRFTVEYAENLSAKLAGVPEVPKAAATPQLAIAPSGTAPWSSLIPPPGVEITQTDLCEIAVKTFGTRQASTTEIRERLNAAGHDLDQEKVRSALAYLMRQERVVKVSPGVWRLPGAVDAPLPFVPLEPAMNGTGGRVMR